MVLSNHAYILLEDNSLWSMGDNESGQLGIGKWGDTYHTPQKIMENVLSVSNGAQHGIILDYRGRLYGVGDNKYGQLGLGSKQEFFPREIPIKQYALDTNGQKIPKLDKDGNPVTDAMGAVIYTFSYVTFVQISAGAYHSAALDKDGNVWLTGAAEKYQTFPFETNVLTTGVQYVAKWTKAKLIDPDTGLEIKASHVECGFDFTVIVSRDNKKIYGWGCNERGELGIGEELTTANVKPILTAIDQDAVLRLVNLQETGQLNNTGLVNAALTDTTTTTTGTPITDAPVDRLESNYFRKIEIVGRTSFALENDGTLWSWGYWGDFINAWPKKLFENVVHFDVSNDKVYVKIYNTNVTNNGYTKEVPLYPDTYGRNLDVTPDLTFFEEKTNKVRLITPNKFMKCITKEAGWEKIY